MPLTPDSPVAQKVYPSPNHGERVGGVRPSILLLHYTGMRDAAEALLRLANPVAEVSCHYFVFEDGRVLQMVPEARRAWHAGRSSWAGVTDINSHSIGIEIANPGHEHGYRAFPERQMAAVVELCRDILGRWSIEPHRVLAHSDVAPGRKEDPGELFDWRGLAQAGVGLWTEPRPITGGRFVSRGDAGQPVEALQSMFALYGYGVDLTGSYDRQTEAVVAAFQRHFRPARVDGIADASTIVTLRDLLRIRPAG